MGTEQHPDEMLDDTDFTILVEIAEADEGLWKKKVHDRLEDSLAGHPLNKHISTQTVGRRIDRLTDRGYLASVLITPDELDRDLMIGYRLTDDGKDAVDRKRMELIKECVQSNIFPGERIPHLDQETLVSIIVHEFDVDDTVAEKLQEYTGEELVCFLSHHFIEAEADEVFHEGNMQKFTDLDRGGNGFRQRLEDADDER